MTNRKKTSPDEEEMDKELLDTIIQINDGLDKLDSIDHYLPSAQWFEQMVADNQEKVKKNLRKELGLFILSALFIISTVIFTMMEIPQLFLILQAAAVAVTVLHSYKGVQKQVDGR
ncbi:MAG TPA: hypothetical protein DCR24_09665 [Bacillus bacterium]|nr:hypothetical protein [Bacillus sp. (in: firmicutes)]